MVKRMQLLKSNFRAARVLVVGDVMLDEYVVGAVSRISPEAPVPVLDVRSRYFSAGGAANVAMNIASLGATVYLIGVVGNDATSRSLRDLLVARGISDEFLVETPERATISKTRIVAGQQQICRIDHEDRSPIPKSILSQILDRVTAVLDDVQVLVLSDYAKGALADPQALIRVARAAGVPPELRDSITTLVWAAPRVDVWELQEVREQLRRRYAGDKELRAVAEGNGRGRPF
jgi:D-beta-D-heptose 7-phosphate kinase/D-beta-D-heptose 1-phosphate adenosyltransferase